jgi:protoheme ferro-lyase
MRSAATFSLFCLLILGLVLGGTSTALADDDRDDDDPKGKYVVCHRPPGNPGNAHTIEVGSRQALRAHLRHGDTMGPCDDGGKIALLFVGHGEPENAADGDVPITLADGEPFGPHAATLGVPEESQYTEWAAAYEEIATAMTYILPDFNGNGVPHEMYMFPVGDVPPFFSWPAFHGSVYQHYAACGDYSPHNDSLRAHVESLKIGGEAKEDVEVDVFLAFLDAVPRIRDLLYEIDQAGGYSELVVVPMLLADSTHTQEVTALVEESAHLTEGMDVLVLEPFFEVPFMKRRFRDAVIAMIDQLRAAVPPEVPEYNIGVVLASHGSPYVPPFEEFGWHEDEIFSYLVPTEDAFHEEVGQRIPWVSRTGRMSYSSPTIEDALAAFEADGFTHVLVAPSAFPTAAIHTMWDVASAAVNRAVLPEEGIVEHTRDSGMVVYYSAQGFADLEPGRSGFRKGLEFLGEIGVLEALEEVGSDDYVPFDPCPAGQICVTVTAGDLTGGELKFLLYETTEEDWPQAYGDLPTPGWVVIEAPPMPERFPARLRIPIADNLLPIAGDDPEGARLGLAIASADGPNVEPTDSRGFSSGTVVHHASEGLDFGEIHVGVAGGPCEPGEICVTVTAQETTGPDIKLLLYSTTEEDWPGQYLSLPTPTWVVTQTTPVPENFPVHIRIPLLENLYSFTGEPIQGAQIGLAVVTGVAANFVVDPTDARGFSAMTRVYTTGNPLNFGHVDLSVPEAQCDLNPYHPYCLSGRLLWEEHLLGDPDFVPGAIYLDVADLDGDGIGDIVMVGEPHFEDEDLPLTALKLGIYYMNEDLTVRETEIVDSWSEDDPTFYSPWGVNVIDHGGEPMIIVGLNIPELAPLEEGNGDILSYHREGGDWVRSVIRHNPDPTVTNYNAMIVVSSDMDGDGDEDLAVSGAFQTSSVGNWMENTGQADQPWIEHFQPMAPGTDPHIRGTLAYKSADLNGDGYPEVVYNAMFDVPDTDPPLYRGEIWLAVNPGPQGWADPWEMIVIDDENWASADMWFHDFDGDGFLDLVANQIFSNTVTIYRHPGADLSDPWEPHVIIEDLASPSDMWLVDMDEDGLMDVVSADHTAHRGVWHRNSGEGFGGEWIPNLIFPNILLPGDFAMLDADGDGDLDWVGTSVTLGQAFIVEQVQPENSLVATVSAPSSLDGTMSSLVLALASSLPMTGPPAATLATIPNEDTDNDGVPDLEKIFGPGRELVLSFADVGVTGEYHVVAMLYMEGGGQYQPVPGIDYMTNSAKLPFGGGQVEVDLELELVPDMGLTRESKPRRGRVWAGRDR